MKKLFNLIILFSFCNLLSGCCINHNWMEATCTEPQICAKCGEAQGDALGHTWIEATCSKAKTCSVCKITEGDILAHTWINATCTEPKTCSACKESEGNALGHQLEDATYQSAAICTICKITEGEPLQSFFDKNGYVCDAELNVHYPYITSCYRNEDVLTTGEIFFSDYETFESAEGYDKLEGYEWKRCIVNYIFNDSNAWDYGYKYGSLTSDYYDGTLIEDVFTVNYNGVSYTECTAIATLLEQGWNRDTRIATVRTEFVYRVPIGYDGLVINSLNIKTYDAAIAQQETQSVNEVVDETSVFFRLN